MKKIGYKCIKCGCEEWVKGKLKVDTKSGFFYFPHTCKNCGYEYSLLDYITVDKVDASTITLGNINLDQEEELEHLSKLSSGSRQLLTKIDKTYKHHVLLDFIFVATALICIVMVLVALTIFR